MPVLSTLRRRLIPLAERQGPEPLNNAAAVPRLLRTHVFAGIRLRSSHAIHRVSASMQRRMPFIGGRALDVAHTGLRVTQGVVTDIAPGPMVTIPLQVASAVVEIAQTVRSNKEDCRELAREVQSYADVLSRCQEEDFSDRDLYALQELQDQLDATLVVLQGIASQKFFTRMSCVQRNKENITRCKEQLANAFRKFTFLHQMSQSSVNQRTLNAAEAALACVYQHRRLRRDQLRFFFSVPAQA